MKTIKFLGGALMCSMFMLSSCDNDDNFGPDGISNEIYKEFARLYPDAKDVKWDSNGTYAIASFENKATRAESVDLGNTAWFEIVSHKFVMDEHDISFTDLPVAVKAGFEDSEYALWEHDDDVDVLRRMDKSAEPYYLYVIEVEKDDEEYDLYFDATGLLVREVPDDSDDNDFTELLPSRPAGDIENWLEGKYQGARIVDIDNEDGGIEVEFVYKGLKHEALLTMGNKWVYTKIDYRGDKTKLPADAMSFIEGKHGHLFTDFDIEQYECADEAKNFFKVEIELVGELEYEYYFDYTGKLTEKPDFSEYVGGGLIVDAAVQKVLDEKYPKAVVVEKDYDDGLLEFEIRHDGKKKDVYFTVRKEWVYTKYDLKSDQLLDNIKDYINKNYADYKIDDAEVIENAKGITYIVEVEGRFGKESKLMFDVDGNFIPKK